MRLGINQAHEKGHGVPLAAYGFAVHRDLLVEPQKHDDIAGRVVPEAVQTLDELQDLFPTASWKTEGHKTQGQKKRVLRWSIHHHIRQT